MTPFQTLVTLCLMAFTRNKGYPTLRQAVGRRLDIWADERRGLDFLRVTQPSDLGLDEKLVHRGSPSGNKYLRALLQAPSENRIASVPAMRRRSEALYGVEKSDSM